jgi:hypothetical protein
MSTVEPGGEQPLPDLEDSSPGDGAVGQTGPLFDTNVANQARIYDYLLGGKDNYAADRAAVDAVLKVAPEMGFTARANRAFLGRVVRYLAAEAGIQQFLDIGTGILTAGNTHQVAQAVAPESRSCTWTTTVASRVVGTQRPLVARRAVG